MTYCRYFYTTRKGNHSATLIPRVVGGRRPLPSEICVQSDPSPSKNADFDRFPLITSQPYIGDSEKSSITTKIKSTTGFPTSHRWSAYVTPKCPKGWLKKRFFSLLSVSQRLVVSSAVNLVGRSVLSTLMVSRNVVRISPSTASRSVFSS